MKIYKYIVLHILVLVVAFFTAPPSFAEELSDNKAYERVLTVCLQTVYPLWLPKEGKRFNEDRYALTPLRQQKIAACMREKGVPAAFDEETQGIVLTESGFGRNVDVKIEDLFPGDVMALEGNPQQMEKYIPPAPDSSLPADDQIDAAGYDEIDARLMKALKSGETFDDNRYKDMIPPEIRKRESLSPKRPPPRSGTGGVITGRESDKNGGSNDAKPIFLPR